MPTSPPKWLAPCLLAVFLIACGDEPAPSAGLGSSPDLVGVYSSGSPSAGIKLTLGQDGTYYFHTFAGHVTSRGVWEITDDVLVLTSRSVPGESYRYRVVAGELHRILDASIAQAHSIQPPPLRREIHSVPAWAKVAPEQFAEAKKYGVPVAFENDIGMRFVLIPAGTFMMGSPEDEEGRNDDETQHEVTITKPYYLSIYEVTNRQYREFRPEHRTGGEQPGRAINADLQPVAELSWFDASSFAEWLSKRDRARTFRLPTEAEWEYACRAGTKGRFFWGEAERDSDRHANVADRSAKRPAHCGWEWTTFDADDGYPLTAPVGSYLPNPWGLYDMLGNVCEWCGDWYANYPTRSPVVDPTGPTSPTWACCMRGGSWCYGPDVTRSAMRGRVPPDPAIQDEDYGFRLVSSLPKNPSSPSSQR